jgi:quinol monooxygenase YgiN
MDKRRTVMAFIQTIDVQTPDGSALAEHLTAWHAEQGGVAPGYQGYRLLADRDRPGQFRIVVDFNSAADAKANDGRPETAARAAKLSELTTATPSFGNFDCLAESAR